MVKDSFSSVLRTGLRWLVRKAAVQLRARLGRGGGPIEMPDLATVDDTPRGRRNAPIPSRESTDQPGAQDADDRDERRQDRDEDGQHSPGQLGPTATVEVQAREIHPPHTAYHPETDGDPDPGEIVWTWVPYEEEDGRGKDRPVLVVAREDEGTVLAVQLSSGNHDGDRDWLPIGTGDWDHDGHPSWVDLERVLRVHPEGMRREATKLDRPRFERVAAKLAEHHGWV